MSRWDVGIFLGIPIGFFLLAFFGEPC